MRRLVRAAGMVAALVVSAGSLAAQQRDTLPRPPGHRIVSLPRHPGDVPGETSVAIDPRNHRRVLVAFQNLEVQPPYTDLANGRVQVQVARSEDGGLSWSVAEGTAPSNYLRSADPSVTFDLHGHAFLAYIAYDATGKPPYWGKGASRNGVYVRRSLDAGRSWEAAPRKLVEYPTMENPPFQDKAYLVADNRPSSPYAGNMYVGWTSYSLDRSEILFSRSTDDGATWSQPIVISTEPGVPRGSAPGAVVGFHAAIGADGVIYAIWPDGQSIVLAISRDGGRNFEPSRRAFPATSWALFAAVPGFPGANGLPAVAVDPRSSPGALFIAWADYRYGDVDILLSTSSDGGRTWAAPVRVNDDAKHNGRDQVLSWLAVDPSDGAAYVQFYDRRGDADNVLPALTLARSTDGGRTFTNYAWSAATADPKRAHFGDYIGIAATNGRVYGAWTEDTPAPGETAATTRGPLGPSVIRIGVAEFVSRIR